MGIVVISRLYATTVLGSQLQSLRKTALDTVSKSPLPALENVH